MTAKAIPLVLLFAAVLLVPANALVDNSLENEKDYNYDINNKLEPDHMYTQNPMQKNIETNLTDLTQAHSDITNLMITQNDTPLDQYTGPDIPFTMVYIDDDTLVVGLDPAVAYFDVPVEPEYIQFLLDITQPVEIQYVEFMPEHHNQVQDKSWQDKYKDACQPVNPGYQKVCTVYADIMQRLQIPIPVDTSSTGSTTTTTPATPTKPSNMSPCVAEPKSNACYYYKLYHDRCTDGKTYKRCNTYATIIKNAG